MADEDLPISGKDVRIELFYDGAVQGLVNHVQSFTEEPIYSEITSKPIGSSVEYVDQEHDGWQGEIELLEASPQVQEFLDAYNFCVRNRIPQQVFVHRTTHYRDGRSNSRTYVNVKIAGASRQVRRGQHTTIRLRWRTGEDRV